MKSSLMINEVVAYCAGEEDERDAILAKVRREIRRWKDSSIDVSKLVDLERWILDRRKRHHLKVHKLMEAAE